VQVGDAERCSAGRTSRCTFSPRLPDVQTRADGRVRQSIEILASSLSRKFASHAYARHARQLGAGSRRVPLFQTGSRESLPAEQAKREHKVEQGTEMDTHWPVSING